MDALTEEILATISVWRKCGVPVQDPRTGETVAELTAHFPDRPLQYFTIHVPPKGFHQPPVEFEKRYGLKGIAYDYTLPAGLTSVDLQAYADLLLYQRVAQISTVEQFEARVREIWNVLAEMNPALRGLKYGDPLMLYDMIRGVASAFNPSDIDNFNHGYRHSEMEARSDFKTLTEAFKRAVAPKVSAEEFEMQFHLGWVASPETLKLIKDLITQKNLPRPSGDAFRPA